jgi:enoyl-CoA hydratase
MKKKRSSNGSESDTGVRVIRLDNAKANAIDLALLETLRVELDSALESGAKAIVLTGYDKYFSAGLNLTGLPDTREGMLDFAEKFNEHFLHLYQFPLPVIAAVNGHAIAGGCVLASACDIRIGREGSFRIGVSETDIGVSFPSAALGIVQNAVHPSWAVEVILDARLLSPGEAKESGLLHAVADEHTLLGLATEWAERLGAKPQPAFGITKRAMKADVVARIEEQADEGRQAFVDCWFSESVAKRREQMLKE